MASGRDAAVGDNSGGSMGVVTRATLSLVMG